MRLTILLAALGLASSAAQAGTPYLELTATSPTTIQAGGTVNFRLSFNQYQENWSFDNNGPEPTADIGFQEWIYHFYESSSERLSELELRVGVDGGPELSRLLLPDAGPGTDYSTEWNLSLVFSQPGVHQVLGSATATQDKTSRRGDTFGTRECVGFDNSVQCSGWSFIDRLHEDGAWSEPRFASSLGIQVQVQAVPEPPTAWLLLAGAGLMLGLRRRP
jgi:hypothetical protein